MTSFKVTALALLALLIGGPELFITCLVTVITVAAIYAGILYLEDSNGRDDTTR